tara:strand:- start:10 stop:201 length:192 start_codon:yes stop_codon:yes gene_type:complete
MAYWVVGGTYKNTNFKELETGYNLERYGPFNSYEEAKKEWDQKSWSNVDNCFVRYVIIPQKKF